MEVKLPTYGQMQQQWGEQSEKRKAHKRKKRIEKVEKARNAPERGKVGLLGAEPSGRMRDQKNHAAVVRSRFRSQNMKNTSGLEHFWTMGRRKKSMLQTLQVRNTFVSLDVEKMDVALERSTCKSQNICNKVKKIQNTPVSNHFWKFSC